MVAIQQALGMFNLPGASPKLIAHVSFDSRDDGWNKQIAESVPIHILQFSKLNMIRREPVPNACSKLAHPSGSLYQS